MALNEAGVITGALLLKAISSGRRREVGVIIYLLIVLTSHYSHTSNLWEGLWKNLLSVAGLISIKFTAISKCELGAFPSSGCALSRLVEASYRHVVVIKCRRSGGCKLETKVVCRPGNKQLC